MASYSEHILDAQKYANLCNADCHIPDFCEHLDLVIKNLKQARKFVWGVSRKSVNSNLRTIKKSTQDTYHALIDRCYHHYFQLAHKRLISSKNDFANEINIIYAKLNKENQAYATECIKDIDEYIKLAQDNDNLAKEAKLLAQKQEAVAQQRAKEIKEFDKFLDGIAANERDWIREQQGLVPIDSELSRIDAMEGLQFEYWCAEVLEKAGFIDVSVTRGSGDQGVDVLATKDGVKYAIQCKCYHSDLGNSPVQEINTGKVIYHCHVGAVMTNRYFTKGAIEAAEATGVLLWDRDKLIEFMSNTK